MRNRKIKTTTTNLIIFVVLICLFCMLFGFMVTKLHYSHALTQNENTISNQTRIKYYLGNVYFDKIYVNDNTFNNNYMIHHEVDNNKKNVPFHAKVYKMSYDNLCDNINTKEKSYTCINDIPKVAYRESLKQCLDGNISDDKKTKNILFCPGDNHKMSEQTGIITKSRNINDPDCVLLKLNTERHWKPIYKVKENDIPYEQKTDTIIWRGGTTGIEQHNMRTTLVKKFYDSKNKNIDIGFSNIVQNKKELEKYVKNKKSMKDMLKCKFIVSVDGNDVSSGLKWHMASNSLVFMPKPRTVSWFMEDMLKPDVHYILVEDDFSDLEKKHQWAIEHPEECKRIIKNANEYVAQFMDEENEKLIMKYVMMVYYDNVLFTEDFSNIESFGNIEPVTYNKQKNTYVDELMDNIYINNVQNKDKHVIPKTLYKTGIEEFENISTEMLQLFAEIKHKNPEINIVYFSNSACRTFIAKHFGDNVLTAFDCLLPGSYKADLFRYCVLYVNGGIYGDLTQTYLHPFDKVIDYTKDLVLTKDRVFGHKDYGIQISFIACKPRLNIFKCAIQKIIRNINNTYYGKTSLDPTGPRLFKLCFTKEKQNLDYQMVLEEKGGRISFIDKSDDPETIFIVNKLPSVNKILKRNKSMHYSSRWKNRDIYLTERSHISNKINLLHM